jgi:DNA-binding MarR family transcriptional regulator
MKAPKKTEKCLNFHHSDNQVHLIREIMRAHHALLSACTREVGIPPAKLALLRLLAINYPDKIGVMELARLLGINAAAVTRQVKEMESEHLINRIPDSRDGRRNYITLTQEGIRGFEYIHKRAHEFEARLDKEINPADRDAAIRVLSQVRITIEKLL